MRSLYRGSFCCGVAMADHSCAMGCSPCWLSSRPTQSQGTNSHTLAREQMIRCLTRSHVNVAGWGLVARVHPTSPQLSAGRLAHVEAETSYTAGREPGSTAGTPDTETQVDDAREAIEDVRRQLAEVPAEMVIANHVMGLYELAAIHLSANPPDLSRPHCPSTPSPAWWRASANASATTSPPCAMRSATSASPSCRSRTRSPQPQPPTRRESSSGAPEAAVAR